MQGKTRSWSAFMEVETAPELAEEQLALGADEVSDSPPEEALETDETPQESTKRTGVAKRIDELTANWRAAERREEELRRVVAQLAQQQQPQVQPVAPPQQSFNAKPTLEDFNSYEEFTEALTDWKATQAVQTALQQREAAEAAARAQREQAERAQTWQQRASEASTKFNDFHAVALNPDLPVSPAMAEVIQSVDNGPDVLYHLGKNPAEAARIAALPPTQAAFALGSLAAALQPPTKATPRPVPQPINPLAGGNAAPMNVPDPQDTARWIEQRRAEIAKRR